jgi:hypothetical protein
MGVNMILSSAGIFGRIDMTIPSADRSFIGEGVPEACGQGVSATEVLGSWSPCWYARGQERQAVSHG